MEVLPDISIIIPAYNEENRLPKYFDSIFAYFGEKDLSLEIIVVDDGSTDSTALIVESYASKNPNIQLVLLPHNTGKGHAVKIGMLQAAGKLRLFTDADGATPIAELERLQKSIQQGADVAIASRALHDHSCVVKAKLHRKIIGSVFNLIVRTLTVRGIRDTQCGFKLFTDKAAKAIFPLQRIAGFGFDVEILFIASRNDYRIIEVPVNWTDIPRSKVKLFRDSYRMFIDILKIRINDLRGLYLVLWR